MTGARSEAPTIRVRAVRRGFTNEAAVIAGPHGDATVFGRTREPGQEWDCAYPDLALTLDEPQLGWMEPATEADLAALVAYRAHLPDPPPPLSTEARIDALELRVTLLEALIHSLTGASHADQTA